MAETKHCPYCGEEILAVAKKCKHCGEWLEKQCPSCGKWIEAGTAKCQFCGYWLDPRQRQLQEKVENEQKQQVVQGIEEILKHLIKTCPYCGEEIQAIAKKCEHCGEWLPEKASLTLQTGLQVKRMTTCPCCAEEIEEGTTVCPYCHETLVKEEKPMKNTVEEKPKGESPTKEKVEDRPGFFEYYLDKVWRPKGTVEDKYPNFDFSTPMPRKQFWISMIIFNLILGIMLWLIEIIQSLSVLFMIFLVIVAIGYAVKLVELQVRRLRDIGKSPWWVVLSFIPVLDLIPFVMYFFKGSDSLNTQWTKKDSIVLCIWIFLILLCIFLNMN